MKFFSVIVAGLIFIAFVPPAGAGETGLEIFKEYGCNQCHSVRAAGIGDMKFEDEEDEYDPRPPDLSDAGLKRDGKWIVKYLRKKIDIEGRKHKKRFKGTKEEFKTLRDWLLTLKTPTPKKSQGKK